jgi:hypothetical protein
MPVARCPPTYRLASLLTPSVVLLAGPHSPVPLGQSPGNGLQKRIETSETVSFGLPSSRRRPGRCRAVARALPCQIWRCAGICSSTTMKPGCWPDLCTRVGHAVVECIKVFPEVRRERCTARRSCPTRPVCSVPIRQVCIQEVVAQLGGCIVQFRHAVRRVWTERCWVLTVRSGVSTFVSSFHGKLKVIKTSHKPGLESTTADH